MDRSWLRAALAYIGNFVTALIGTAIIETGLWRLLGKAASPNGIVARELLLSVAIAFTIGMFVSFRWPTKGAMWIWIPPVALLLLRVFFLVTSASKHSILGPVQPPSLAANLGIDMSGEHSRMAEMNFLLLVVPTVRTLAYSAATLLMLKFIRKRSVSNA